MSQEGPSNQEIKAEGGSTISNVIQMVVNLNLAEAWSSLTKWAAQEWRILLVLLAANALWLVVFSAFQDKYLLEPFFGLALSILINACILLWYRLFSKQWKKVSSWMICIGFSLTLFALIFWKVNHILHPPMFSNEKFGIAIARFGHCRAFQTDCLSQTISDQVIAEITNAEIPNIEVLPIGFVENAAEATQIGTQMKADLVIWGEVVLVGTGNVFINFEILESPDRYLRQDFPRVLLKESLISQRNIPLPLQADKIRELARQQASVVTYFSLGLASYFTRDYATAAIQFNGARNTLLNFPRDQSIDPCDPTHFSRVASGVAASSQDTRLGPVYYYLGRAYQFLGRLKTGECWLNQASVYLPNETAIPLSIAYGYNSLGDETKARELAQQVVDIASNDLVDHPKDIVLLYNRALAFELLKQYLMAAKEFDAITNIDSAYYAAYLSAGGAYLEAGNKETALERYQTAIDKFQNSNINVAWGYLYLAEVYEKLGDASQAETNYQKALLFGPGIDWIYFRIGNFYENHEEPDKALEAYQKTLLVTFDPTWAHSVLGAFFRRRSMLDKAIAEYQIVQRDRSSDTLSQTYLAELYDETGRADLADQTYQNVLTLDLTLQYAHASYGRFLVKMGHYAQAIQHFQQALALNADDGITRFNLGRAFEANGEISLALHEYRGILDETKSEQSDPLLRQNSQERFSTLEASFFTPTNTPKPTATSTPRPTRTPTPTVMLLPTSTPQPTSDFAVTVITDAKCRSGPSVVYDVVLYISQGQTIYVRGRNEQNDWLLVEHSDRNTPCWLSKIVLSEILAFESIPIIPNPPTPTIRPTPTPANIEQASPTPTFPQPNDPTPTLQFPNTPTLPIIRTPRPTNTPAGGGDDSGNDPTFTPTLQPPYTPTATPRVAKPTATVPGGGD
jgi:tetratricopeptide (TPR) repeat protein